MKIKFLKSPVAQFNMAYAAGTEAELPDGQCEMLIEAGYAVRIDNGVEPVKEVATSKAEKETPEDKPIDFREETVKAHFKKKNGK